MTAADARLVESLLAARVLDALLQEDYGGLRRFADGRVLRLPGGPVVPLRRLPADAPAPRRER